MISNRVLAWLALAFSVRAYPSPLWAARSGSATVTATTQAVNSRRLSSQVEVRASGPSVLDSGSKFQTFCVEYSEHISFGAQFNWTLNTGAVAGGVSGGGQTLSDYYGGTGIGDRLDPMTAYVFTAFSTGVLSDYMFDQSTAPKRAERTADATQLRT